MLSGSHFDILGVMYLYVGLAAASSHQRRDMSIETGCGYSGTPAGCYVSKKLLKSIQV